MYPRLGYSQTKLRQQESASRELRVSGGEGSCLTMEFKLQKKRNAYARGVSESEKIEY